MRAGCGLAVRGNVSGNRAQSVRDRRACARTFKPSPCRSAASPQVDLVGSALLRGPQRGVSAMAPGDARDAAELQALALRISQDACTFSCWKFRGRHQVDVVVRRSCLGLSARARLAARWKFTKS